VDLGGGTKAGQEGAQTIWSVSFWGLLLTQFLTTTNDNVFRWLVIGIGKDYVDSANAAYVLMAGTNCFILPYILLAAPSGYLADRYSKRRVITVLKFAEILIMLLAWGAIYLENLYLLFGVVTLMGIQAALFAPARLGAIPEILRSDQISMGNGLYAMVTMAAVLVGTGVGNLLADVAGNKGLDNSWLPTVVLVGIAAVSWGTSLLIEILPVANPLRKFPWNAFSQTIRDVMTMFENRSMRRIAYGIIFFWAIASLAQLNIDQFAFEGGATHQTQVIWLLVALVVGVAIGSVAAGWLSHGQVELGLLPIGAFGIGVFSLFIYFTHGQLIDDSNGIPHFTANYWYACFLLFSLGASAGLFDVPLNAYLQQRCPTDRLGSVMAACNFLTFTGIFLMSILFFLLRQPTGKGDIELAPAVAATQLSAPSQQKLAEIISGFPSQRKPGVRLAVEEIAKQFPEEERKAVFSRLLWEELKLREESYKKIDPGWITWLLGKTPVVSAEERAARLKDYFDKETLVEEFSEKKSVAPGAQDPDKPAAAASTGNARLASQVYDQIVGSPRFDTKAIFLMCALATFPVCVIAFLIIPQATVRCLVLTVCYMFYQIRVYGRQNVKPRTGALLVSNHVSWLDGALLLLTNSRPVHIIAFAGNFSNPFMKFLGNFTDAILIGKGPKSIVAGLTKAREALAAGELVAIFPEGGITRTGQVQGFKPGVLRIVEGAKAPIIPVYIDELWGSIFSFEGGKFFWKWPKRWPYPISIHFGHPIEPTNDVHRVRQAVLELGASAVQQRTGKLSSIAAFALRACKKRLFKWKASDSMGKELTGGKMLAGALILRSILRREILSKDEKNVGLLVPPSIGGLLANLALALDKRVTANLNYTVDTATINQCIDQAKIKHIITSRRFMEKVAIEPKAELVYLEDLLTKPTRWDKISAAIMAYAIPSFILERMLGLLSVKADDVLTLIFTSGSTGQPKGVMLTHGNITTNVHAFQQMVHLRGDDVLVGILPFFHSFGYTVTLWGVASLDIGGAYHFSPLDAKIVGKLAEKYKATVLLATPTFLRMYLKRVEKEEFKTLNCVVTGAEKLPKDVGDAFEAKYGVRPVEGYGTTELSPVVSVNVPPGREIANFQVDRKEGSVGRPLPGVIARIIHQDTGVELSAGETGMLQIKGPNVMKGYLDRDDLTAQVLKDGWYTTGDLAIIDEDGFIHITGRLSRFSKIGGEMAPHILIEECLARAIDPTGEGEMKVAVTAVADERKGERLVVLHTAISQTPDQLRQALVEQGLPNLFVPAADSFFLVEQIPVLGTGKLDLRGLKTTAEKLVQGDH
jgi:acyl-[acyl-carrier-protein]-phospholipid O-acyltransferase / long-chain-fatty-acid--[acyl-carrier-protein] ligase